MANDITTRIWQLDTKGVVTWNAVKVRKIVLYPALAGDAATIASLPGMFVPGVRKSAGLSAKATMEAKTVTVTSNSIITSTGNDFETAEVAALDIIDITYSSTGNNVGGHLVLTRNGDTNVTTSGVTLVDDVAATYNWVTYTPTTVTRLLCPATEKSVYQVDFSEGMIYDNFILTALTANAKLEVYLW